MLIRLICIVSLVLITLNSPARSEDSKEWKWKNAFSAVVVITGQREASTEKFIIPDDDLSPDPYKDFFKEFDETPEVIIPPKNSLGTGFFISEIHVVTNYHVVKGMDSLVLYAYDYPFKITNVELIGFDEAADIAILEVGQDINHTILEWADEVPLMGDDVYALGHGMNLIWTLSKGILSYDYRPNPGNSFVHYYQVDAVINPGNSGGPLLNEEGKIIGVNTLLISPIEYFIGYGYVIPFQLAERVAGQIIQTGVHVKPSIGIMMGIIDVQEEYDKIIAAGLNQFLEIKEVSEGSSAERFGLKAKDLILKIDGYYIEVVPNVIEVLWQRNPGDEIIFEIYRDGEIIEVPVILGRDPTIEIIEIEVIDEEELEEEELLPSEDIPYDDEVEDEIIETIDETDTTQAW